MKNRSVSFSFVLLLVLAMSGCGYIRDNDTMMNHGCSPAYTLGYNEVKHDYRPPLAQVNRKDSEFLRGQQDAREGKDWRDATH